MAACSTPGENLDGRPLLDAEASAQVCAVDTPDLAQQDPRAAHQRVQFNVPIAYACAKST